MTAAWAVAIKEVRQIRRDRRTLIVLLFMPAFFLLLYGYALNFDIRHVSLGVEDRDESPESRQLIASFVQSTYFDVSTSIRSDADVGAAMDRDRARAVLVIPSDFSRKIRSGAMADVQIILNGDNANTATTVLGYATEVLRAAAPGAAGAAGAPGASETNVAVVEAAPRAWYNPELRSSLFLVPGLIAYLAMISAVVATALSIVKEKETGTMEQIRMAPISTPAYVIGKTLPYLVISQASAMLVVLASMALFDLPMRGNWLTLSLLIAVFLAGALGTGLLVSTAADTQQVAFQAGALVAFLPTLILSGFIFPIASMPVVLQWVTRVVPARYFLVALRGVVLKGLSLGQIGPSLAALVLYAVATLGLSAARLTRR
jgi:ABC-2 type transport system permease protein